MNRGLQVALVVIGVAAIVVTTELDTWYWSGLGYLIGLLTVGQVFRDGFERRGWTPEARKARKEGPA